MNQMICFKHPTYTPDQTPDLKCQCCCKIYVDALRQENQKHKVDIDRWLSDKSKSGNLRIAKIQVTQYCPFSG